MDKVPLCCKVTQWCFCKKCGITYCYTCWGWSITISGISYPKDVLPIIKRHILRAETEKPCSHDWGNGRDWFLI